MQRNACVSNVNYDTLCEIFGKPEVFLHMPHPLTYGPGTTTIPTRFTTNVLGESIVSKTRTMAGKELEPKLELVSKLPMLPMLLLPMLPMFELEVTDEVLVRSEYSRIYWFFEVLPAYRSTTCKMQRVKFNCMLRFELCSECGLVVVDRQFRVCADGPPPEDLKQFLCSPVIGKTCM